MDLYGTKITNALQNNLSTLEIIIPKKNLVQATILRSSLFVFFLFSVALRPMSTAMVIAGWSVHLTTLFPGQA